MQTLVRRPTLQESSGAHIYTMYTPVYKDHADITHQGLTLADLLSTA